MTDTPCNSHLTVAQAFGYWLENRRDEVKKNTWSGYRQYSVYIIGPLLLGTRIERVHFARRGEKPEKAQFVEMLGSVPISELTTARIRAWHKTLTTMVSPHTANAAKWSTPNEVVRLEVWLCHRGGLQWRRNTSLKRSLRSCGRLMF